ncbi:MAG: helix-turn-helix transcriptional regulator [Bacteroidetes bacterium]|nr:helix-turn-helix transcriptional regulator [Bacteroidota bacterium]
MEDYYQYFPVEQKDPSLGFALLNTGSTRIDKNSQYPPVAHPAHHNFSWQDGRVLREEYQLIYINRGGGLFESESCRSAVTEGSLILLQPGERHRYRPDKVSGWDESWVGFRGNMVDEIIRDNYYRPEKAVFRVGFNETVVNLFNDINRYSRQGGPGHRPVIAGAVIYLLGLISGAGQGDSADAGQTMVNRARALFRERVRDGISPERVAEELRVSYSLFRKAFKQHTGVAPGQYLLGLKIGLAKQLLADPNRLIKEIAYELNMDSPLYFGKLFKEKVGVSPAEYRRQITIRGAGPLDRF